MYNSMQTPNEQRSFHLSTLFKFYIYGLHGYLIEIWFTGFWESVAKRNWKFSGYTSIWSLPIYGLGGLLLESMSLYLKNKGVSIYTRGLIYVLMCYTCEFTSGSLLSAFGACFWDYSDYDYNFRGLITLEFAPAWLMAGLLGEKLLVNNLQKIQWIPNQIKDKWQSKIY